MTIEKLEKMYNYINKKFGTKVKIFKTGGQWSVFLENGNNEDNKKMKEIREYIVSHYEELEDDEI